MANIFMYLNHHPLQQKNNPSPTCKKIWQKDSKENARLKQRNRHQTNTRMDFVINKRSLHSKMKHTKNKQIGLP